MFSPLMGVWFWELCYFCDFMILFLEKKKAVFPAQKSLKWSQQRISHMPCVSQLLLSVMGFVGHGLSKTLGFCEWLILRASIYNTLKNNQRKEILICVKVNFQNNKLHSIYVILYQSLAYTLQPSDKKYISKRFYKIK